MTLRDYRTWKHLKLRELAELLGVPYWTACAWVYGSRRPGFEAMLGIELATRGRVSIDDWRERAA